MNEVFLNKLLRKEFDRLTVDELRLIIRHDNVFSLSKKDTRALEKIITNHSVDTNEDKIISILETGLPTSFAILHNLDKQCIREGTIEIDFRAELLHNLNQMTHLQLCVFIDKVLKFGKDEKLRFFRNKEYSLHAINGVISQAFGLSLVFEIFKPGKYKTFQAIDSNRIDKKIMIDTINSQVIRYLYILVIIAEVVLATEEATIFVTKINKMIRERIAKYVDIIHTERSAIRATGITAKQNWNYTLCHTTDITIDEEDEFYDEEDDDE